MKDALLRAGYCVSVPCLAGHGLSVEELAASTWKDWYETVRVAFAELRSDTERVYFAGISWGALLGLRLAMEEGWGVRAMVLMATPLRLGRLDGMAVPLVRYTPLRWIVKSVPKDFERSVADPEGRQRYEELSLPAIPTSAVFQIADLQKEVLRDLNRITNPLLLLHGAHDAVSPPANVELVKKNVSSDIVESIALSKSRHVLTMDYDKEIVAQAAVDFFGRFA